MEQATTINVSYVVIKSHYMHRNGTSEDGTNSCGCKQSRQPNTRGNYINSNSVATIKIVACTIEYK